MDYVRQFFIRYFILLCVGAILYIISIQRYKRQKRVSLCMITIVSLIISLAIFSSLEEYSKEVIGSVVATTIFAILGYVLRPVCIYLFIIMCGVNLNKKQALFSYIPLIINFIVFMLAFIPGVKQYIVTFIKNDDGTVSFGGGKLRFISHIVSFGYLIWLIYLSISKLRNKHISNAFAILSCALFIILAVVIETFFNDNGDVFLLYPTIAVSALQYYLFLYFEKTQTDTLTGLLNRETFYHDLDKMDKSITGVIQFDMNGLKFINDNYGHMEGDKALKIIGGFIIKSMKSEMYAYRLGGDEFVMLVNNASEEQIQEAIAKFKAAMNMTSYYCSVGYAYRDNKDTSVKNLMKAAEKKMYEEKSNFYISSSLFKRRSTD